MEEMFVCILGDLVQNKPVSNVASNRNEALNVGSTVGTHSKADGFQTECWTAHNEQFSQELKRAQDEHDNKPSPNQNKDFLVDVILGDQAETIDDSILTIQFHFAWKLKRNWKSTFCLSESWKFQKFYQRWKSIASGVMLFLSPIGT